MFYDLMHSLRSLRRSRVLAITVVCTTAVSLGCLVGAYQLIDVVFLRDLTVNDPAKLALVTGVDETGSPQMLPSSLLRALEESRIFSGTCGFLTDVESVEFHGTDPEFPVILGVSSGCVDTLGVKPFLGHFISHDDEPVNAPSSVVLSFKEWQNRFSSDRNVIGTTVRIAGKSFTVVGVAAPSFPNIVTGFPPAYIVSASHIKDAAQPSLGVTTQTFKCWIMGRTSPGITIDQAKERLTAVWPNLLETIVLPSLPSAEQQSTATIHVLVSPGRHGMDMQSTLESAFSRPLYTLLLLSLVIVLLCCINTAGLFVTRALTRKTDLALRQAIGASRIRMVAPMIFEVVILLSIGAIVGIALAQVILDHFVSTFSSDSLNLNLPATISFKVAAFVVLVMISTSLLSVLLPSLRLSKLSLVTSLRGSSSVGGRSSLFGRSLTVIQVALTLSLVGLSGTFGVALWRLAGASLGFRTDHVLTATLTPIGEGYGANFQPLPYYSDLLARIDSIGGSAGSALSSDVPLSGLERRESLFLQLVAHEEDAPVLSNISVYYVTDGYFDVLKIPFILGHGFSHVPSEAHKTVVITRSAAHRLFPNSESLGRYLRVGKTNDEIVQIVGVTSDVSLADVHTSDGLAIFLNYWDYPDLMREPTLLTRFNTPGTTFTQQVRESISTNGREYPLKVQTLDEQRNRKMLPDQTLAGLSVLFGLVSVLLMMGGIFSLLTAAISARYRELAIRAALGSTRNELVWLAVRDSVFLVLAGAVFGVFLLLGLLRVLSHSFANVPASSLIVYVSTIVLLLVAAVAAMISPCLHATKISPIALLKGE